MFKYSEGRVGKNESLLTSSEQKSRSEGVKGRDSFADQSLTSGEQVFASRQLKSFPTIEVVFSTT